MKLLNKERVVPSRATKSIFLWAPCFALCASLRSWFIWPHIGTNIYCFSFVVPIYLCLTSLHVYGVVLAGWASNSIYAILGTLRAIAQTISYELPLVLIVLGLCYQVKTFSFLEFGVVGGGGFIFL